MRFGKDLLEGCDGGAQEDTYWVGPRATDTSLNRQTEDSSRATCREKWNWQNIYYVQSFINELLTDTDKTSGGKKKDGEQKLTQMKAKKKLRKSQEHKERGKVLLPEPQKKSL